MAIDLDTLKRLEAEADRKPWVIQPEREGISSAWREALPSDAIHIETKNGVSALGDNVASAPAGGRASARLICALRNAAPDLLAALEAADQLAHATGSLDGDECVFCWVDLWVEPHKEECVLGRYEYARHGTPGGEGRGGAHPEESEP